MKTAKRFYLSFADDDHGGFRGACVVMASDELSAVARANQLGISPGGQVLMLEWKDSIAGPCPFPLDRLMDAAELKFYDSTTQSIREFEEETGKTVDIPDEHFLEPGPE